MQRVRPGQGSCSQAQTSKRMFSAVHPAPPPAGPQTAWLQKVSPTRDGRVSSSRFEFYSLLPLNRLGN